MIGDSSQLSITQNFILSFTSLDWIYHIRVFNLDKAVAERIVDKQLLALLNQ